MIFQVKLVDYLLTCSKMNHGLTLIKTRSLEFFYALANENQSAGIDWLRSFIAGNHELSISKPEGTSLARCTAFNRKA